MKRNRVRKTRRARPNRPVPSVRPRAKGAARKRRRQTQQASEGKSRSLAQLYPQLIEHLPGGAAYVTGGRLTLNKGAESMTGYRRTELTTLDEWFTNLFGSRAAEAREIYEADRSAGFPIPSPMLAITRKDGQICYMEFAGSRVDRAEIWLMRDVTKRHAAEAMAVERDEFAQSVVSTATDAIITIDPRGIIQTVNPATERMFGYESPELVGQNIRMLMPAPYHDEHDGYLERYGRTGEARIIGIGREVQARRKDGSVFPADLSVSEIGSHRGFTGILRDISERKALQRRLTDSRIEEAQSLAQELHDGLGGELTGIGLIARTLHTHLRNEGSPLTARAEELVRGVEDMHKRLRSLAKGFMPVELVPEGLMQALRTLAERTQSSGVPCQLECPTPVYVDSLTTATHLFRIAQEAVSNAVRHAQPKHIEIRLGRTPTQLQLSVTDDGRGMGKQMHEEGLGLHSMRERARLLGGTVTIGVGARAGLSVLCTVPLPDNN